MQDITWLLTVLFLSSLFPPCCLSLSFSLPLSPFLLSSPPSSSLVAHTQGNVAHSNYPVKFVRTTLDARYVYLYPSVSISLSFSRFSPLFLSPLSSFLLSSALLFCSVLFSSLFSSLLKFFWLTHFFSKIYFPYLARD